METKEPLQSPNPTDLEIKAGIMDVPMGGNLVPCLAVAVDHDIQKGKQLNIPLEMIFALMGRTCKPKPVMQNYTLKESDVPSKSDGRPEPLPPSSNGHP